MPAEETKRGNFWRKRKRSAASISVAYLQNNGLSTVKEIKTRRKRPRDVLEINGIKTKKSGSSLERIKKKIEEGGQIRLEPVTTVCLYIGRQSGISCKNDLRAIIWLKSEHNNFTNSCYAGSYSNTWLNLNWWWSSFQDIICDLSIF